MTQAAVATLVHQTLDVHLGFTTQVTFNGICGVDVLTNSKNFRIAQLINATGFVNVCAGTGFFGRCEANSGNISEGNRDPLVGRDVYASNSSQGIFLFYCGSVTPEPFFTDTGPELKAIEPAIEVLRALRKALMILLTEIGSPMWICPEGQDLNLGLEKSRLSHPRYRPIRPQM